MSTVEYAHPEVLVDTNWVLEHHKDANVRIAEVDYDSAANYNTGHVPGAVLFDWKKDINDPLRRDILSKDQLEALFGAERLEELCRMGAALSTAEALALAFRPSSAEPGMGPHQPLQIE